MMVPVPQFTAPSYGDRTLNEVQKCVNLFPEQGPNGWRLVSFPGYSLFSTFDAVNNTRGAYYTTTGRLFCAADTKIYELSTNGTATNRGTIVTGSGIVYFADNGIQMMVLNGVTGAGYIYTLATNAFAAIADVNFPLAKSLTYQDGYFIVTDGSGIFYLSALNDGTLWTPRAFATAESKGDALVTGQSNGQQLYLFGTQTTEAWYNTGNASFPFERINGATHQVGCPAARTVAQINGSFFFFGASSGGKGSVWQVSGTDLKQIAPPYLQKIFQDLNTDYMFGLTIQTSGAAFYVFTETVTSRTFVYNITNGTWFERVSQGASDLLSFVVNAFDQGFGRPVGFDRVVGKAYYIGGAVAADTNSENGQAIVRQRIFGPIESNSKRVFHAQIRIEAEVKYDATGTTSIAPTLDWTDDGGLTYSTALTLTKAVTNTTTGQRVIFTANRLGSSPERYYRLTFTGPAAQIILTKCELDLREGRF